MGQSQSGFLAKNQKKREQSSQVFLDSNFQENLGINNDELENMMDSTAADLEV
jgi:hypothetical protein